MKLPPGTVLQWSGQYEAWERARARLTLVVPLTLLVVFLLLYLNFRRLTETLIVMLSLPFALVGGVWLLWAMGFNLSVAVTVGFIALSGVAAETGVIMLVYLDHALDGVRAECAREHRPMTRDDLRRAITLVTQESFLFSGSVADNIAIGRPSATRAEVEEAGRAVGVHDLVMTFPDGYDTPVDSRGVRLSAGQRQLVSFARAFLADPAVLVLDEATSSLDVPGEQHVQEALERLLADRTAVVVAHRLSTVMTADRVLVVEGGRVVEDGSPAQLVAGGGRFARLHEEWQASISAAA